MRLLCRPLLLLLSRFSSIRLCDPTDGSPSGSPIPGILQVRTLEWVATSFSNASKWKIKWSRSVMSDSLRPHGQQPSRLLRPWDFPGKSTGVECHCLLRWTCLHYIKIADWLSWGEVYAYLWYCIVKHMNWQFINIFILIWVLWGYSWNVRNTNLVTEIQRSQFWKALIMLIIHTYYTFWYTFIKKTCFLSLL